MSTTEYRITQRPVTGDISRSSRPMSEQIGVEEFLRRIDAVFAHREVESIKWQQYTPYFNDGEECIFSVHDVGVKITGVAEDAGGYGDGYLGVYDVNPKYRGCPWDDGSLPEGAWGVYPALEALGSEDWENIARENFGDHAEVIATREGFSVEYYEHD